MVFPFPREHPELSLLLNHDLQLGEREDKTQEKNKRVLFHYESAGVRFTSETEQEIKAKSVKGIVHWSSFSHTHVIPNPNDNFYFYFFFS